MQRVAAARHLGRAKLQHLQGIACGRARWLVSAKERR